MTEPRDSRGALGVQGHRSTEVPLQIPPTWVELSPGCDAGAGRGLREQEVVLCCSAMGEALQRGRLIPSSTRSGEQESAGAKPWLD